MVVVDGGDDVEERGGGVRGGGEMSGRGRYCV